LTITATGISKQNGRVEMQGKDDCDDIVKSMPQFWEAYELLE
jgi:hypothetical protein